jgi:putative ABC transport system permease protein
MPPDPARPATRNTRWLVSTPAPVTWAQIKQLNTHGIVARSRYVMAHPPAQDELYDLGIRFGGGLATAELVLIAGVAVLEIVLLAGPAFAVGARRRRRDLALVAAAGGTPAHLRRIVLADGIVLGAVAAAIGIGLGITAVAAGHPMLERLSNARSGAFRVALDQLAGLALLAVITGILAALVPAWISSRQDIVTALAGRRGVTRSRRRWVFLGLGLVAAGAALAGYGALQIDMRIILGGLITAELGLVLCTPAFVGLVARLGRFLPASPRIALRDASRNRTAAAPAIAAVMAAVAGSLAIGMVLTALSEREREAYYAHGPLGSATVFDPKSGPFAELSPSDVDSFGRVLRDHLPVDSLHGLKIPACGTAACFITAVGMAAKACPYSYGVLQRDPTREEQVAARRDPNCQGVGDGFHIESVVGMPALVVEERDVAVVTLADPAEVERIVAALRAGAVIVDDPRNVDNGQVTLLNKQGIRKDATGQTITAPGYARTPRTGTARVLMTPATAKALGLGVRTVAVLATTTRVPTTAEQDEVQAAASAISDGLVVDVERGPQPLGTQLMILAIVSGLITLVAAALATGLAAADSRADVATLAAVGASPRMRRTLTLSQSGVIAGLGSLLGTVAGVGAATAVLFALNRVYAGVWPEPVPYPISVPWLNVGIAVLVVPLVAMLGTGLLTRSRLPIERRQ